MQFSTVLCRFAKLYQVMLSTDLLRALVQNWVLAGAEHRHIIRSDLATVIDIGANRGQFSLAARHWAPGARVVAFEPLAGPARIFRRVFKGDSRVRLHESAIGPKTEEANIHVSAADDSSSLLPISKTQQRIFPGTEEVRTETIEVGRLADFISADEIVSPAMLKLDVQGFELEALRGCEDLLGCFESIYVECSFVELYKGQALADEVIAWLRERWFKMDGVYNVYYSKSGRAVQGDFLFLRKEKLTS